MLKGNDNTNCIFLKRGLQFFSLSIQNSIHTPLVENATSPWGQCWERVFQDCPHGKIRHSSIIFGAKIEISGTK
jgi:hypothetical protein